MRFKRPPDLIIGEPEDPYLLRWWVLPRNRWFNIYLHKFLHSDDDRALHDHPWRNMSIVLKGAYVEHLQDGQSKLRKAWRPWAFWRLPVRSATALHRVELIGNRPVWTLFLTGPVVRRWGFACPKGWVFWEDYVEIAPGGNKTGRGCD